MNKLCCLVNPCVYCNGCNGTWCCDCWNDGDGYTSHWPTTALDYPRYEGPQKEDAFCPVVKKHMEWDWYNKPYQLNVRK